eukprot:gene5694-biopygen13203
MRTDIRVIDMDTVDATLDLIEQGMHPLVLNMADIHNPGGCVSCGGGMQEESLFRRTNYHRHLSRSFYPIGEREAVVSFDVDIIRECERDGFEFLKFSKSASFLACPCISMPQLVDNRFSEKDSQLFREKLSEIKNYLKNIASGDASQEHTLDGLIYSNMGIGIRCVEDALGQGGSACNSMVRRSSTTTRLVNGPVAVKVDARLSWTVHREVEEHLKFIDKIESAFNARG